MESNADENSPPRSDLVAKTRRQSTLLDSPSRVTRSQVKRLSSAPAEPPMSPTPTIVSRRRSVRVSESISEVASQEDVSSIQDEADTAKPVQRTRRSTRRSFAESSDASSILSQRSTLTSIEEDSKPVTRRTRASLKPLEETESELVLPPTRRTRRSSISSVTSVSTIASNAPSPQRRTRASRRNLSPVPSPTFSEVSVISEVPEVSPSVKKTLSPSENLNRSSKSITPNSSNASPAVQTSVKTPSSAQSKRFSLQDKSPMLKTSEVSFTTPRQLNLNDLGSTSKKRSSLTSEEVEVIDVDESDTVSTQKSRKSQGRLSLTSKKSTPQKPNQFVESPLEEPAGEIITVDLDSQSPSVDTKSPSASVELASTPSERPRRNSGRLSLSKFVETPFSESPQQNKILSVSLAKDADSPTNTVPELNKSLNSSKRLSVSNFVENSLTTDITSKDDDEFKEQIETSPKEDHEMEKSVRKSTGRTSLSSVKSPELEKSQRKSVDRLSTSSMKSPELEKSQRNSISRHSLNSNKSLVIDIGLDNEDSALERSSRKSTGRKSTSPVKSPELEKSQRKSVGRQSLSSNKSFSIGDQENEDGQLEKSRRKSSERDSVSPVKSPELEKSQRMSVGRQSLTSNKSFSSIHQDNENVVELDKSGRKSTGRVSVSPAKSLEPEKTQRKSVGRLSLASNKSYSSNDQENESDVQPDKSGRKSTERVTVSPAKSPEPEKSQRKSVSRLSHNSNQSLVIDMDHDSGDEQPEGPSRKSLGRDSMSPVISLEKLDSSRRQSSGRLSLTSDKSVTSINQDDKDNEKLEKCSRKSSERDSVSPMKSPELEKSRKSVGRLSAISDKSLSTTDQTEDKDSLNKSSRKSTEDLSISQIKSPDLEKSQRNSFGRLSLTSNKSSPVKLENSPHLTPKDVANLRSYFASSTPTAISQKNQSAMKEISLLEKSKLSNQTPNKSGRLSLTSGKLSGTPTNQIFDQENEDNENDDDVEVEDNDGDDVEDNNDVDVKNNYHADENDVEDDDPNEDGNDEVDEDENDEADQDENDEADEDENDEADEDENDEADEDENDEADNDGNSEDIQEKDSSHVIIQSPAATSRRASTGNNLLKKTFELEGKGKYRASTGSLPYKSPLKSPVMNCESEELSTSHINNLSKGSSHSNNSSSFNDRTKLEMSEGLNVSPIKQDQGELKNLTLTPSSSENSYNGSLRSPNQALEKSTVFNEQDVSFGSHTETNDETELALSTSRSSSRMNSSQRNLSSTDDTSNKVLNQSVSGKVYKDAAFLLSGGNVSDFDDQEDDDANQWERFSSPATKSKKEKRLEKKAKKKAEKELGKKRKLGLLKQLQTDNSAQSDANDSDQKETNLESVTQGSEVNEQVLDKADVTEFIHSDKSSKKRRSGSLEPNTIKINSHEELDTMAVKRTAKRKSLPDSEINLSSKKICMTPVEKHSSDYVESANEDNVKTLLNDFVDIPSDESVDCIEPTPSDPVETSKKNTIKGATNVKVPVVQEKIKKTKKNRPEKQVINLDVEVVEPMKQKKKKKKVKDHSNVGSELENQTHEIKKKKKAKAQGTPEDTEEGSAKILKKKKKVQKLAESDPEKPVKVIKKKKVKQHTGAEHETPEDSSEVVKIKKKKVKEVNLEAESGDNVKLVKKKKKKSKLVLEAQNIDVLEEISENIVKKKLKKNVVLDTNTEDSSASALPKKKLKKQLKELSDLNSVGAPADESVKIKKKKKKQNKTSLIENAVENGNASDSDEAPAAVSFAAGKASALAELSAAAESIKKQKEIRKQKLKIKQERIREEKLEKMNKLKKKQKLAAKQSEVSDVKPSTGVSVNGSSYKIYFDGENSQKSKLPKRLPDDFLESLSEQPPTKIVRRADGSKERVVAAVVTKEEQERLERKKARKLARRMERQNMLQSDYVPLEGVLGSTRFGVVPLRNIMLAKKLEKNKLADEASNFRQQSLFGNRIRRTPITTLLSHKEKLKAAGKDKLVQPK